MVSFLCYPRVTPLYCKSITEFVPPAMDTHRLRRQHNASIVDKHTPLPPPSQAKQKQKTPLLHYCPLTLSALTTSSSQGNPPCTTSHYPATPTHGTTFAMPHFPPPRDTCEVVGSSNPRLSNRKSTTELCNPWLQPRQQTDEPSNQQLHNLLPDLYIWQAWLNAVSGSSLHLDR